MTLRERILAVYRGQTPDVVPYMLDLSHWFYHRHKLPWDCSAVSIEPEYRLIAFHKTVGAGDQVPPGAEEDGILLMRDPVSKYGRY